MNVWTIDDHAYMHEDDHVSIGRCIYLFMWPAQMGIYWVINVSPLYCLPLRATRFWFVRSMYVYSFHPRKILDDIILKDFS